MFESEAILLTCPRKDWDNNTEEIFYKWRKEGKAVVRNYTCTKDPVGPSSIVLKQSLLLKTSLLSKSDLRVLSDKEKDYYVNSNLKLVSERLIFGGSILELIAVKQECNIDTNTLINNFKNYSPPLG